MVVEAFPDETIAVHLGTGRYFSIDPIGAEMLDLLASGWTVEAVAEHLGTQYDRDAAAIENAVEDFAGRLLDEGLIVPGPGGATDIVVPEPVRSSRAFSAPTLSVYTDMEDLLLLDPIHDVDDTGWPVRAESANPDPAGPRDSA